MAMTGRVARCLLLLLAPSYSARLDERTPQEVYVREGGTLILDPGVNGQLWTAAWYCDGKLVIESEPGRVTRGYGTFGDAASSFGGSDGKSLRIQGWKEDYAGTYRAEITVVDQSSKWVRTFTVVSIATVEVNIVQTLYLSPNVNGRIHHITWEYGPYLVVECNHGVNVFHKGAFERTSWMNCANGGLSIIDWKAYNDGTFTVKRSGTKFKQFEVTTLNNINLETGTDLILDPKLWIKSWWRTRISWGCDGKVLVPDSLTAIGDSKFDGEFECMGDRKCVYDKITWTLTVKKWINHDPITCSLMTSHTPLLIKVTGGYVYANLGREFVIDPPAFNGQLTRISWYRDGDFMCSFDQNRIDDPFRYNDKRGNKGENTFLSRTTGQLTMMKLEEKRVGVLTVEINGQMMPDKLVITPKKPIDTVDVNVQLRKNCTDTGFCELVCDGDTEQREPVKYFWRQRMTNNRKPDWVRGSKYMETHAVGRGQYSINACKITSGPSERQSVFFGPVVDLEVEIGTSLYLDPEFGGTIRTIVWKNGDDVAITCEDGVEDGANVVYHGKFRRTTRMTNQGKLIVSDWKPFQQNVFTVEINGGEWVKKFQVTNIVRVPKGERLNFWPKLEGMLYRRYNWYLDGTEILRVLYDFDLMPTQKGMVKRTNVEVRQFGVCRPEQKNCSWVAATGKLTTTKPWDINGELTLAINHEKQSDKIKLVTGVVYVPNGTDVTVKSNKLGMHNGGRNDVTVNVNKLDTYTGGRIVIGTCLDWATTGGCTLVCDEDVDGAEPVMYLWRDAKTKNWVEGTKHMESKYVVNKFNFNACKMINPVSEQIIFE